MTTSPYLNDTAAPYARHRADAAVWAFHTLVALATFYVVAGIDALADFRDTVDRRGDLMLLRMERHTPWIGRAITGASIVLIAVSVYGLTVLAS